MDDFSPKELYMKAGCRLLAISAISLLSLNAFAQPAPADTSPAAAPAAPAAMTPAAPVATPSTFTGPDISGNYRCTGNDFTGKNPYSSPAIVTRSGDTFSFQWLNANGYPYNLGTGIFNKSLNSVVAVVFWDPKKPDSFGTLIYQIQSDGSLAGNWVYQGSNQIGTETCTKVKA